MIKKWLQPFKAFVMDRPLQNKMILNNRFLLKELMAFGGYGITYVGFDLLYEEKCVIKQLRPSRRKSIKGKSSFKYEVDILKQLNHSNIPRLRDEFKYKSHYFLAMDYVEGKTFEELIFRDKRQYFEFDSFHIVYKLLDVVDYIHRHNIVHRDLRIPNIILNENELHIIDFGLARYLHEKQDREEEQYFAEKRLRRQIDITSDFYAIGHFVLFLLYSSFEPSVKKEQSWEVELNLSVEGRHIIQKLLQIQTPYSSIEELKGDIKNLLGLKYNFRLDEESSLY